MIDLHCHLLPGVDDGPEALTEAVEMCRMAADDGCDVMFATPHQRHPYWWNGDRELLKRRFSDLQEAVGDTMSLLPGAEIHVDSIGLLDELQLGEAGELFALGDSSWVLLELSRQEGFGPDPEEVIHELRVAGWRPILAHPEMYPWLMRRLDLLERLIELGATTQVTAMSLTGDFGPRAQEAARQLIDAGWVHFVASDAHDTLRRPPGLRGAEREIARRWGEAAARALTEENPRAVVENRPLVVAQGLPS